MEKTKVKSLIKQIRGVSYKPEDLHNDLGENSVMLLRANNIDDGEINFDDIVYVDKSKVSTEQYLKYGDILICASSGSKNLVGKAASVKFDKPCTFGAFCKVVRPEEGYDEYLGVYFQSPIYRHRISEVALGANINNIRNEHIDELDVPVFSNDEQVDIVKKIHLIQGIITKRRKELVELDTLIKAQFVEMFGDVIHNDKKWSVRKFTDITTSRLGKMLDAKKQTGMCSYPYLANFNVQWFRFDLNNLNEMDFDEKDREEFKLEDGDLLVCEGGEIGRCAVWHNQVDNCFFQKALHRVRCNKEIVLPDYLAWWFKYNCENSGFAVIEGSKATIPHLTGAKMKLLEVTVPPIEVQNQFVEFVKQVDKSKVVVQKALDETQILFNCLMQKYFG